jgi:hypothetical protein
MSGVYSLRMKGRAALGLLPPDVTDRLAYAAQDELDAWGKAILSALSLEAMFKTRH